MGRQLIKQPDGKYAVWSEASSMIIFRDLSAEKYVRIRVEEEQRRAKAQAEFEIEELETGAYSHYKDILSWDEALKRTDETINMV